MYNAKQDNSEPRKLSTVSDIRDNIVKHINDKDVDGGEDLTNHTLPRAFHKKKVPKSVRDFIERAKSNEPYIRRRQQPFMAEGIMPHVDQFRAKSNEPVRQDGTESVSSFVVLSPSDHYLKFSASPSDPIGNVKHLLKIR